MSDLISRQDAIEAVARALWHYPNECYKNLNAYDVAEALVSDAIKSLPSAEAVEVVRCKDCIRTKERDEYTGRLWCSIHRGYMEDTYYCADGLRREDGDEA